MGYHIGVPSMYTASARAQSRSGEDKLLPGHSIETSTTLHGELSSCAPPRPQKFAFKIVSIFSPPNRPTESTKYTPSEE
jgi:hypothetical protein